MPGPKENHHATQTWSGRFSEAVDERVKRYTGSVFFDKRLALHDIAGSLAHAKMLTATGIITASLPYATKSPPGSSSGRSTRKTCISISSAV